MEDFAVTEYRDNVRLVWSGLATVSNDETAILQKRHHMVEILTLSTVVIIGADYIGRLRDEFVMMCVSMFVCMCMCMHVLCRCGRVSGCGGVYLVRMT